MSDTETTFTKEQIIAIGGKLWTAAGKTRVYLNDWPTMVGLDIDRYRTGNISNASLDGEHISNAAAGRLLGAKVYWEDGQIVTDFLVKFAREGLDGADAEKKVIATVAERVAKLA